MASYFFDASALVKRYVMEAGTAWVQAATDPSVGNTIFIAQITMVEVVSAIKRKERESSHMVSAAAAGTAITNFLYDYHNQYEPILITDGIISSAVALVQRHVLSAADAVQLAAAMEVLGQLLLVAPPSSPVHPLTFVGADSRLNLAAGKEGLNVRQP